MLYVKESWRPALLEIPPDPWRTCAMELLFKSQRALVKAPKALDYLTRRGIPLDAAQEYGLGFVPRNIYQKAAAWGDAEREKIWIPRGIVIPAVRGGELIRLRVRRSQGEPKYYVVPGSRGYVLIARPNRPRRVKIREIRAWIIVESEFDALACAWAQPHAGAIGLGSALMKPDAGIYTHLKGADALLISLDNDRAGEEAARWWVKTFSNARLWPSPLGKDPGEFVSREGTEVLRDWILEGLPPVFSFLDARPHADFPHIPAP